MLKKLIALGAMAAATVAVPATAANAEDCTYAPQSCQIPTVTTITAESNGPGTPVILTVSARGADQSDPAGDIAVKVLGGSRDANAPANDPGAAKPIAPKTGALFSATVHFTDQPVRIDGPSLPKGTYTATAALTPDSSRYLPSQGSTAFKVGLGGTTPGQDNGGTGLPDTGGPNLVWLLLGSGLVVGGAGGVLYARRREPATV